jgi:hypothetical protein
MFYKKRIYLRISHHISQWLAGASHLPGTIYQLPAPMDPQVSQELTVALTPSQVKLCSYNEEEPAIWFRPIEAQYASAGIQSQKIKMATPLPTCPSKSFETFWIQSTLVTTQITLSMISQQFCWGNLARANGYPILSCFVCPWEWKASSPAFSWAN